MLHISVALATLKKYVAAQGKLQLVSRVSTNVRCLHRTEIRSQLEAPWSLRHSLARVTAWAVVV